MSKFDRQTERMLESQARQRGITVDELIAEGDRLVAENPDLVKSFIAAKPRGILSQVASNTTTVGGRLTEADIRRAVESLGS
jgi:hypothetical protein